MTSHKDSNKFNTMATKQIGPEMDNKLMTKMDSENQSGYDEELKSIFSHNQQVVSQSQSPQAPSRSTNKLLTQIEDSILKTINTCLKNWYVPWRNTFLEDGREFKFVYDLMEGLLHYEYQITQSESALSNERTNAIAQAVARLIDCGNAILGMDLVIRSNDDAFSETDPLKMTTIELFQAHIKAQSLREKLLYDYFKKDKPTTNSQDQDQSFNGQAQSPSMNNHHHLQIPRGHSMIVVADGSHRSPRGSTTSINSLVLDTSGRRTPSLGLPSPNDPIDPIDLDQSVELTHMLATIKSRTFSSSHSSTTRLTLLPGVLLKIENLLNSPANSNKLTQCFDLLDALLNSIEKLPDELRENEVSMISVALLRHLVRKVHVDGRDDMLQFQHAHWTTYLLSLVRLMSPNFNNYLEQFNNLADLGAFLNDYLFVVKRLLSSSSSSRSSASLTGNFDAPKDHALNQGGPTYPECWIEMTFLACSVFLSSLKSLYQILHQVFPSNSNMWLAYIDCLLQFPSHESLRSSRLLLKEQQKLLADDIRRTSAEHVWISWESLSLSQKRQLLEDLMDPLLRACMALHSKHRSILLPIFYDMMRCDYTVQYITPRNSFCASSTTSQDHHRGEISSMSINVPDSFSDYNRERSQSGGYQLNSPGPPRPHPTSGQYSTTAPTSGRASLPYLSGPPNHRELASDDGTVLTKFTHLMIGKLYNLILDLKLGEESFSKELCAAISGNIEPNYCSYNKNTNSIGSYGDTTQFKLMAKQTSNLIAEFLQICMDSLEANRLTYKHLYLLCLFKLILFFRDKVDRPELYLTNLYKLSHLHHGAQRYVEAGYTLLEHAKSLYWSNSPLENHHRVVTKFFNISQQQLTDSTTLKIFLYNTIMEYFDQGQNWEAAVPLCRELINYYEFKTYDYGKLAQQLDKMSGYFKLINDSTSRNGPEYFRVTFYGKGFPRCLKDMTVIYRGRAYEKLGDFQSMIMTKYPDAKPLSTLSKPDRSVLDEPEARYLQVNACEPVVELRSKFPGIDDLKKLREPLLNYYKHNCCDKFQFSRRINQSGINDDDVTKVWRERTTLTTNTFPGMLPFFPVYLIETSIISPIEMAIEDLERLNDRLATMVNRFRADERHTEDVRLLSQLLLGVVDAAVNGGIRKYEEGFFLDASSPTKQQQQHESSSPLLATTTALTSHGASGGECPSAAVIGSTTTTNDKPSKLMVSYNGSGDNIHQTSPSTVNQKQQQQQSEPHDDSTNNSTTTSINVSAMDEQIDQQQQQQQQASVAIVVQDPAKVDKLKYLIAKQVPLLDEAIQLHRDRVADVMRPQHDHLEASYKKLKHHITNKYYRYLPHEYSKGLSSTLRSYRSSMSRNSPRGSTMRTSATDGSRSLLLMDSQQQQAAAAVSSLSPSSSMRISRLSSKRMSDVGGSANSSSRGSSRQRNHETTTSGEEETLSASSIPYKQLANERKISSTSTVGLNSLPVILKDDDHDDNNTTRTQRDSVSRDSSHANNGHQNHQYEEITNDDRATTIAQLPQRAVGQNDGNQDHLPVVVQPPAAPRACVRKSSIKIRIPFAGSVIPNCSGNTKKEATKSVNDESQYMHLINCDRNDVDDNDDDDGGEREGEGQEEGQELGRMEKCVKEETNQKETTIKDQSQSNCDEMNLVSF